MQKAAVFNKLFQQRHIHHHPLHSQYKQSQPLKM
jgi:hypothetical protein